MNNLKIKYQSLSFYMYFFHFQLYLHLVQNHLGKKKFEKIFQSLKIKKIKLPNPIVVIEMKQ